MPCSRSRDPAAIEPRRERAAVELLARRAAARSGARPGGVSICPDDAEDALQRAIEILLTKAPPHPPAAARRVDAPRHPARGAAAAGRARAPARPARRGTGTSRRSGAARPVAVAAPCPAERYERVERARERARRLRRLKPQERRALCLKAEGYSYAEICELTGWSYTKVNRCLAEGRARLRALAPR